jgi:hypothetical protein
MHVEDESEEEEQEEEEGKGGGSGNAQAGPSQVRATAPISPVKAVSNGTSSAHPAISPALNGKGKGKAEGDDADHINGHTPAPSEVARLVPKRLAPSLRPAPKGELCVALAEEDLGWPAYATKKPYGAGLNNPSMACYVNSTMQVMLHTPPLLKEAVDHGSAAKCKSSLLQA